MENEYYNDEFELLLKEKADQFRMYPSRRVWHSIYNNLHPSRRWPSMVVLLLLIGSLSFIGYLNTGNNSITRPINTNTSDELVQSMNRGQNPDNREPASANRKKPVASTGIYNRSLEDVINGELDYSAYTVVESNRPNYLSATKMETEKAKPLIEEDKSNDIIQQIDSYIKSNKIYADIAVNNKKIKTGSPKTEDHDNIVVTNEDKATTNSEAAASTQNKPLSDKTEKANLNALREKDKKAISLLGAIDVKKALTNEEKAWIENYVLENNEAKTKLKNRLSYQVYVTPAVNYRKLSSKTKGSATAFASADINQVISQKPGFGMEAGAGITYRLGKKLNFKTGLQFNYTNYNIDAMETNHPIFTTILLNDPRTGYSYAAARTSTTSNVFNSGSTTPVTLHNRTYQLALPIGLAYNLSSRNNVDWFAGASVQPTYVFGGNAHIISSDLKSYVSDPSSISTWNLNLGFETYMNFRLGGYQLQVGPQVRYQVFSTYRNDVALKEKPYAVGFKFGLSKGF